MHCTYFQIPSTYIGIYVFIFWVGGLYYQNKLLIFTYSYSDFLISVFPIRLTTRNNIYYTPINDSHFELHVFWPSDTGRGIKLTFSESVSISYETRWMISLMMIVVVDVFLFYVHGKHLRSCWDGQLT